MLAKRLTRETAMEYPSNTPTRPTKYPHIMGKRPMIVMMSTRACLKSSGLLLENDSSESDSDDTFESYSYMARSVDISDSYLLN